jgi:hypothetical protein
VFFSEFRGSPFVARLLRPESFRSEFDMTPTELVELFIIALASGTAIGLVAALVS